MLLYYLIVALHVLVSIVLILVVLLQSGKGADLAGAFGGGGTQTAFGSRGPASFLSKATTVAAILFMLTSILLAGRTTATVSKSIMDGTKSSAAPVSTAPSVPASKGDTKVLSPEEIRQKQQEIEARQKQAPAKTPEQQPAPAAKDAPPPVKK